MPALINKYSSDAEYEQYISDLINSTHHYLKTRKTNTLLDNFLSHKEKIDKQFKIDLQDTSVLETTISDVMVKSRFKRANDSAGNIQEDTKKLIDELVINIEYVMAERLKRISYYSYLNAMYEMYSREEKEVNKEEEFRKTLFSFPMFSEIVQVIDKHRRINLSILEQEFNLSQEEINKFLRVGRKYINISVRKADSTEQKIISLNSYGKDLVKFVLIQEIPHIPLPMVDEIVVKNCESLLNTICNSCAHDIPHKLQITGISPRSEREITFLYKQKTNHLLNSKREIYNTEVVKDYPMTINAKKHKNEQGEFYESIRYGNFI